MARDPYRYFRIEARELLDQLGRGVLQLEAGEGPQAVAQLLRHAHTLKGAARVVKQRAIADLAHALEDRLAPLRDAPGPVARPAIDALLALLDEMATLLAALDAPAGASASAGADGSVTTAAAPAERAGTAPGAAAEPALSAPLARAEETQALLEGVARTHAQLAGLRAQLQRLQQAGQAARRLVDRLAPQQRPGAAADAAVRATAEDLQALLQGLQRNLATSTEHIERELSELRDNAEQLGLAPAAALFVPLQRTARDSAQVLGRLVRLETRGGQVRLQAELLRTVQAALLQLVRNAVAHGIEPPEQRRAAGKPPEGLVVFEVMRLGRHVQFSCSDDGAGVNLEKVRQAASRAGLLPADAAAMDAQALLQVLLRGGLSTAAQVTEVSGRGVGLDVVRDAVERLHGEVTVRTEPGRGTTVLLQLPLTMAALDALLVQAGGSLAAIPLASVRRTLRYASADLAVAEGGQTLLVDGAALPFVPLARVLHDHAAAATGPHGTGVIVEGADGRAVVSVDRLHGVADVVLRPLPELAPAAPVAVGAWMTVEGLPQLVLDADQLVRLARHAAAPAPPPLRVPAPVLVVDDSLTTRMLEQSILESAGYTVHAAVSAEEGLERARRQRYALFLVDVDMPGMDGFTFVERTRSDPALRDVPAILVTSRNSDQDRRRGREVGAQGYIVKSEFAQAEFLRRVHELVS